MFGSFFPTFTPRRRLPLEPIAKEHEGVNVLEGDLAWRKDVGIGLEKDVIRSKILTHLIKGKIFLTPMETILTIPRELEYLEGLVKLARRQKNEEHRAIPKNTMAQQLLVLHWISISKNHISKTLHLLVKINNYIMESLVDTGATMLVLETTMVKELGIMHMVDGYEFNKIALGVVTHVLGRIEGLSVRIGETKCNTMFMVVDTNNYDVLLGLHFLIKIGIVVDVERGLI